MDHKEQHHEHHEKEREDHKKEQKEYENKKEMSVLPFHPKWFAYVGVPLIILAVVIWSLIMRPF